MWWTKTHPLTPFILLLIIPPIICSGGSGSAEGSGSIGGGGIDIGGDLSATQATLLRSAIRARLQSYVNELKAALTQPQPPSSTQPMEDSGGRRSRSGRRRSKRAIITADNPLLPRSRRKISPTPTSDDGAWVVEDVWRPHPTFINSLPPPPPTTPTTLRGGHDLSIFPFNAHNASFIVSLLPSSSPSGNQSRTLVIVYRLTGVESPASEVARITIPGLANSVQMTEIDGTPHLLPLVPSPPPPPPPPPDNNPSTKAEPGGGSPLLRLDLVRRRLSIVQVLSTPSLLRPGSGALFWSGSGEDVATGGVWLALAPQFNSKGSPNVRVPVYKWQGGYLDEISSLPASNPQSISHFTLLNNHYLAIANYMDQTGSTSIHSELFKWVHREGAWVSFQRIRTFGASHIAHFSFKAPGSGVGGGGRMEHFLAIANNCIRDESGRRDERVKSLIMKWGQHRFVPFKSFYSIGAQQFLPLTWGDKFVLVLLEKERLRLFQYNGWSFSQVKHFDLGEGSSSRGQLTLHPFPLQPHLFLLSSSPASSVPGLESSSSSPTYSSNETSAGGLFALSFKHKNDHSQLGGGLESWCLAARQRLQGLDLADLSQLVKTAPKSHDPLLQLKGGRLEWKGPLTAASITTSGVVVKGVGLDSELASSLDSLEKDEDRGAVMGELRERVAASVHRHQPHPTTIPRHTHIIFSTLHFTPGHPSSGDIYPVSEYGGGGGLETREGVLGNWNGVKVEPIVGGLLLTNAPSSSPINALSTPFASFDKGVEVESTLNGAPLGDYALKSSPPPSSPYPEPFSSYSAPPAQERTFLRRSMFRGGSGSGGGGVVELGGESEVSGTFSGVELREGATGKYLLARGNQSLEGVVRVGGGTRAEGVWTKWLNGKGIGGVMEDGVPLHGDAILTAPHVWGQVSVTHLDLSHAPPLNQRGDGSGSGSGGRGKGGVNITALFHSAIRTTTHHPSEETQTQSLFGGGARFRHLVTKEVVLLDEGERKNKYKGRPLSSSPSTSSAPSSLYSLVNGKYNLSRDFVSVVEGAGPYSFGELSLNQGGSITQLSVLSKLGRLDVGGSRDFGLLLKDSPSPQLLKNKGLSGIHFGGTEDIRAPGAFGGLRLGDWTPKQRYRLRSHSIPRRVTIHGTLSSPATTIHKSLRHTPHHPLHPPTPSSTSTSPELLHLLRNGALKSVSSLPSSPSSKCHLTFHSLHVGGDSGGLKGLNGFSPSDWLNRTTASGRRSGKKGVRVGGRTFLHGNLRLLGPLNEASSLRSRYPEGEDILKALPNLLLQGQDQVISAPTQFLHPLIAEGVDCEGVILAGLPFPSLLLKRGSQVVDVPTNFSSLVGVREGVHFNSSLNLTSFQGGRNLREDVEDTLRTTPPPPPTTSSSSSTPLGHGHHRKEGHQPSGVQVITGELSFDAPLTIRTLQLTKGAKVQEIDLADLLTSLIRGDRNSVLELESSSLGLSEGLSTGFLGVGEASLLEGIPGSLWGRQWLLSSSNQSVKSRIRFLHSLSTEGGRDGGVWVKRGVVGGVDVPSLAANTLRTDDNLRVRHGKVIGGGGGVVFLDNLKLGPGATLNGLKVDSQLVTSAKGSRVTGTKVFDAGTEFHVRGGVETRTLDGADVSAALGFLYAPPITTPATGERGGNGSHHPHPKRPHPHSGKGKESRLLVKGDLVLRKEPPPPTSLNGLDWETLLHSVWFTHSQSPVTLSHPPNFMSRVLFKGGATTTPITPTAIGKYDKNRKRKGNNETGGVAHLNGLSLPTLLDTYLSKSRDQVWKGRVTLQGVVTLRGDLETEEIVKGGGGGGGGTGELLVNGVFLPGFLHSLLSNGSNQTVGGSWRSGSLSINHLHLRGSGGHGGHGVILNGVELDPALFLSLHGPNPIHPSHSPYSNGEEGVALLTGLRVGELLFLLALPSTTTTPTSTTTGPPSLNGVNLTAWKESALRRDANVRLPRPLTLQSLHHAKHLRVENGGYVDGVELSRLLLKTGSQDLKGRVVIEGDLYAPRGLFLPPTTSPLNGQLLNTTLDNLVLKGEGKEGEVVVTGQLTFLHPLRSDHLMTEGLVQGQNLSQLLSHYHSGSVIPSALHFRAKDNYQALTAYTNHALVFAARRATWIQYWALMQVIEAPSPSAAASSSSYSKGDGRIESGFLLLFPTPSLLLLSTGSIQGSTGSTGSTGGSGSGRKDRSSASSRDRQQLMGSWWGYSGKEGDYLPLSSGRGGVGGDGVGGDIRVTDAVVNDILELDAAGGGGGRWAISLTASSPSRPITISIPTSLNHTDIYKTSSQGGGRHSRVYILGMEEDGGYKKKKGVGKRGKEGTEGGWVIQSSVHGKDFGRLEWVGGCLLVTAPSEGLGHFLCPGSVSGLIPTQSIPLSNPTLTTSLELRSGRNLVLVMTSDGRGGSGGNDEEEGVVQVWEQDEVIDEGGSESGGGEYVRGGPWVKASCIPVLNGVSMAGGLGPNSSPWVAIASSPTSTNYKGAVFLYRYLESLGEFEKSQTLEVGWPLEVRLMVVGGSRELLLFILTASPTHNLLQFKFHGVSGWSYEHGWSSPGAVGLEVGDYFLGGIGRSHVFLWGGNETRIYSAIYKGLPREEEEEEEEEYQQLLLQYEDQDQEGGGEYENNNYPPNPPPSADEEEDEAY